jgi:hypothetical protein
MGFNMTLHKRLEGLLGRIHHEDRREVPRGWMPKSQPLTNPNSPCGRGQDLWSLLDLQAADGCLNEVYGAGNELEPAGSDGVRHQDGFQVPQRRLPQSEPLQHSDEAERGSDTLRSLFNLQAACGKLTPAQARFKPFAAKPLQVRCKNLRRGSELTLLTQTAAREHSDRASRTE